jgi:hypothetical protein
MSLTTTRAWRKERRRWKRTMTKSTKKKRSLSRLLGQHRQPRELQLEHLPHRYSQHLRRRFQLSLRAAFEYG